MDDVKRLTKLIADAKALEVRLTAELARTDVDPEMRAYLEAARDRCLENLADLREMEFLICSVPFPSR